MGSSQMGESKQVLDGQKAQGPYPRGGAGGGAVLVPMDPFRIGVGWSGPNWRFLMDEKARG